MTSEPTKKKRSAATKTAGTEAKQVVEQQAEPKPVNPPEEDLEKTAEPAKDLGEVRDVTAFTPQETGKPIQLPPTEAEQVVQHPELGVRLTFEEFAKKERLDNFAQGVIKRNVGTHPRPLVEWIQARKRLIGG